MELKQFDHKSSWTQLDLKVDYKKIDYNSQLYLSWFGLGLVELGLVILVPVLAGRVGVHRPFLCKVVKS